MAQERLGQRGVGLLAETLHLVNRRLVLVGAPPLLDVAEPRARPRRLDPDREQRARLRGRARAREQVAAEGARILDEVVCGEHGHHGLRVAAQDEADAEGHGRRGVALGGFGHDVAGRELRAHGAHGGFLLAVGEDENTIRRDRVAEAGDGFFEHGALGEKPQQLLGAGAAAAGPKTFAAAAGKNEDVKIGVHGAI